MESWQTRILRPSEALKERNPTSYESTSNCRGKVDSEKPKATGLMIKLASPHLGVNSNRKDDAINSLTALGKIVEAGRWGQVDVEVSLASANSISSQCFEFTAF